MRIWEVSFRLKSPALLTKRRTERGFKEALDYIPGNSLRGAIVSSLYYHGRIGEERLGQEAEDPRILCTAGFPLVGGRKLWPAHPFLYECKICKEVVESPDFLPELEGGREPVPPSACRKGHQALDLPHPRCRSFGKTEEQEKEPGVSFTSSVCVGISKDRGASEGGLLYEYDAIDAGQEFWSRLSCEDPPEKGFEFWVGRGVSRGFGWAEITGVREMDVKEEAERLGSLLCGQERVVMYALSPLLSVRGQLCASWPGRIGLSDAARRLGTGEEGAVEVERVYGRVVLHDGGWDMRRKKRRPLLLAAAQGSLAVCRFSKSVSPEMLVALSVLGTVKEVGEMKLAGINQLAPLRWVMEEWR